jgi:ACS family hexuronate transporter-like MFS transporter
MGWQWAFIITGTIGLIWLVFWFLIYEIPTKNKKLSKAEFDFIHSDKDETESNKVVNEKVSWLKLLTYKQTWAFVIGKFFTDGPWWFYLFWLPSFLNKQYGMTKLQLAFPIAAVYTMTTFGSVFGGWISGFLINRGWEVFKARRVAMLIFALCVLPIISAQSLGQNGYWYAVIIIGIAASAHQAWSANLFTTVSDMFPKKAVASIIGIGGMAGGFGGIFVSRAAGWLLDHYTAIGSIETGYYIMFIFCGTIYLLAWIIFNLLAPKMKRVVL